MKNWPRKLLTGFVLASLLTGLFPVTAIAQTQNLLTYSQDQTNAVYQKPQVQTPVMGQSDPFGGTNAALVKEDGTAGALHALRQVPPSSSIGKIVTFSVFAKAKERTWIAVYGRGGGVGTFVNLSTGAQGVTGGTTYINSGVESYGNGWYRAFVTYVDDGNAAVGYLAAVDGSVVYNGDNASGLYQFGWQLDLGSQMSPYRRVDATPYEKSSRDQVAQKQNLVPSSDLSSWTLTTGVTRSLLTTDVTDPNGGSTATKVAYDGSGAAGSYRIYVNSSRTPALTSPFMISIWLRTLSGTASVRLANNKSVNTAVTVTSSWQRFTFLDSPWASPNSAQFLIYSANADNSAFTIYAYGAQAEIRNVVSNLVPTTIGAFNEGNIRSVVAQQQNLITYSEQFDNGIWALDTSGTGSSPTVTANYATAPNGTATADRIQFDKGAGVGYSRIRQNATFVIGQVGTFSVWLKTNDGTTKTVGLRFDATPNVVSVTPSWQRFAVTGATGSVAAAGQIILWDALGTSNTADLSAWGAQISKSYGPIEYVQVVATAITSAESPRIVVQQQQNLLLQSQTLNNASWGKTNVNVTADDTVAPDGTLTADTLTCPATAFANFAQARGLLSLTGTYTLSYWIQGGTVTSAYTGIYDGTGWVGIFASARIISGPGTLTNVTGALYSVTGLVSGQWTRIEVVRTGLGSTTATAYIYPRNNASANAGDSLHVWGMQLVNANWSGPYVPTTSAAVNFGNIRSIVQQNQNLIANSNVFSGYTMTGLTSSNVDTTTFPVGFTTSSVKLIEDSSAASHHRFYTSAILGSTGVTITQSVFAKAGTRTWLSLEYNDDVPSAAYFDLANGVVGSKGAKVLSSSIVPVGGGWYRCSATTVNNIASNLSMSINMSNGDLGDPYNGNGSGYLNVAGHQVVKANWPGAYTPTTGTIVDNGNIRNIAY